MNVFNVKLQSNNLDICIWFTWVSYSVFHGNIVQTLGNSLHGLQIFEIGGFDRRDFKAESIREYTGITSFSLNIFIYFSEEHIQT